MCDEESLDALTEESKKLLDPRLEPGARSVASASLRALGRLNPKDLKERLAPLTNKNSPPPVHALAGGVLDGYREILRHWNDRRPVGEAAYRVHRRLKKSGPAPIDSARELTG